MLQVLLLNKEFGDEDIDDNEPVEEKTPMAAKKLGDTMELSLNSMFGLTTLRAKKVKWTIVSKMWFSLTWERHTGSSCLV